MSDETPKSSQPNGGGQPLNRRRLLKIAAATAPIIATLPSGAALARSSNLIGPTTGNGHDILGRTQCLDIASGTYEGGLVDLGAPPHGTITAITERDYLTGNTGGAPAITEAQMCVKGGEYFYKDSGFQSVKLPPGIVVSAIAVSSLAGAFYINEI